VKVSVPASTANLGPGFDHLGAALSLRLELRTVDGSGWTYVHEGSGAPKTPPNGALVRQAMEAVYEDAMTVGLEMKSSIPVGRGLGSSGAAIVAGLLLGCALGDKRPDPVELLPVAAGIEGHLDNIAASYYGGLVNVVSQAATGWDVMRFRPVSSLRPLILLPAQGLSTQEARSVLPEQVQLKDAVANSSRASGLLGMLTGSTESTSARLLEATNEVIHQPSRASLMKKTTKAMKALREEGIAAAVSGAGPSVVCLVIKGEEERVREEAAAMTGWELLELDWDLEGARIHR
jgi:homoserine kinase